MKGSSFSCHPQVVLQVIVNDTLFWPFHYAVFSSGVTHLLKNKSLSHIRGLGYLVWANHRFRQNYNSYSSCKLEAGRVFN